MEKVKQIARPLVRLIPRPILKFVRAEMHAIAGLPKALARSRARKITVDQLLVELRNAGINEGDVLCVHSSLSAIGNVEGGADTVVDALLAAVGESGTVVMPAFMSADEYIAMLSRGELLDLRTARSYTGSITEALRKRNGTRRSSHPFSSCVAHGFQAEYIVRNHQDDARICHAASPLARIMELNAKIIGLGTDVDTVSVYHCLEDMWNGVGVQPYAPPFEGTYVDESGQEVTRTLLRHDPEVSKDRIDRPTGQWIRRQLGAHFAGIGLMRKFYFGAAPSWIMDSRALFREMQELARHGVTIYSGPSERAVRALAVLSEPFSKTDAR